MENSITDLLSNPLLLLVLGWFLARWDKRGDQQAGASVTLATVQASFEERFKTIFNRLDALDDSKKGHDKMIADLVTQVHDLVTRLDLLLNLGRADALRQRNILRGAAH